MTLTSIIISIIYLMSNSSGERDGEIKLYSINSSCVYQAKNIQLNELVVSILEIVTKIHSL